MATLTIDFDSNNNPSKGYIVKYRQVGTTAYTTAANQTASPIIIGGLGSGASYEGTIQGDCGDGRLGTLYTFSATVAAEFNMFRDPSSAGNACTLANSEGASGAFTFYAATNVLQLQTKLYKNADLAEAFTTAGFYSDGVHAYQVNSVGVVIAKTACNTNVTVTNAGAYGAVCVGGGSVNDVIGGSITVSGAVSQNRNFIIAVEYYTTGGNCLSGKQTVNLSGVIPAGQSVGTVDPCSDGVSAYGVSGICSATGTLL